MSLIDLGDGLWAGAPNRQGRRTISDAATGERLGFVYGVDKDKEVRKHPTVALIRESHTADPVVDERAERLARLRAATPDEPSKEDSEPETPDEDMTAQEAEQND